MAQKLSTEEILKLARKQTGPAPAAAPAESSASAPTAPAAAPVAETSAPPKPAAAPKSTADILAAARAQSGGAKPAPKSTADILAAARAQSKPAAGATEASAPAPAVSKSAAAPITEFPSAKEMVEQLKAGVKTEPAPTAPPALRLPPKPVKAASAPVPRRSVLALIGGTLLSLVSTPFALAWTTLATAAATWVLAVARFMFPNVLVEPPTRFKIGPPSDYPLGTVSTKWTAARGIWVVHTDQYQGKDSIYALASVCTHLGCTPSWLDGEQKFKCPCHGSGFYITGINFEGPAPRPLERVALRLASDGMLEVDKSFKFQEEKGQWEDGKSFVDAALI